MTGILYGVGVGPGDPELLTLKAHRLISNAKNIAYPAPDEGESFARSIVEQYVPKSANEICFRIPMAVARFPAQEVYDQAAKDISAKLMANEDVVVLCEGDPFFYGSFMYLYERLAGEFECEIVPGVNSLSACAAALERPLTARNDVLSVLPGPLDDDELRSRIEAADAIAIMKVGRHLPRIRSLLDDMGLLHAAGYCERASLANQQIHALKDAPETAPYFSMILIYRGQEDWLKNWPSAPQKETK